MGICEASVGKGLLVAVYVEPLVAGQPRDGSVFCVGVTMPISLDCIAVFVPITVVGALPVSPPIVGPSLGGEQRISI